MRLFKKFMNYSLYIFEGVDGTGKTTLGKSFAEKIGGVYYKGLPNVLKPYKNFVDKYMPARIRFWFYSLGNKISTKEIKILLQSKDVVVDQYFYCTIAFHTVSLKKQLQVPDFFIKPKVIIYLSALWEEIDNRLNDRGGRKKLEELSYLKEVDKVYRRIFVNLPNVVYFNTDNKSIEEGSGLILSAIDKISI